VIYEQSWRETPLNQSRRIVCVLHNRNALGRNQSVMPLRHRQLHHSSVDLAQAFQFFASTLAHDIDCKRWFGEQAIRGLYQF
jgi:hypothetical protein